MHVYRNMVRARSLLVSSSPSDSTRLSVVARIEAWLSWLAAAGDHDHFASRRSVQDSGEPGYEDEGCLKSSERGIVSSGLRPVVFRAGNG